MITEMIDDIQINNQLLMLTRCLWQKNEGKKKVCADNEARYFH